MNLRRKQLARGVERFCLPKVKYLDVRTRKRIATLFGEQMKGYRVGRLVEGQELFTADVVLVLLSARHYGEGLRVLGLLDDLRDWNLDKAMLASAMVAYSKKGMDIRGDEKLSGYAEAFRLVDKFRRKVWANRPFDYSRMRRRLDQ